ncbi:MAG: hypothetical protein Q7I99_05695, partial [Acholeplasmataceae bacterium]|nr:hypothetical protein [Acholeplasmataceae bacterium]
MSSLFVIILLMIFFLYTDESKAIQMLYQDYNNQYYHLMMGKIVSFLMPFLITILLMDHDMSYHKSLYAYFGRFKVISHKIILYFLIITWIYGIIGVLYHIIPILMTSYFILDRNAISFFIHIYLDGILLSLIILKFIKDRYKAFAILIPLFYTLASWLYEDYQNIFIYYLFPIYSLYFSSFTLAYLYKLCYILLGLAITTKQMLRE